MLESDLSDDNSYANMLTDDRYQNFARAFSFSQSTEVVQSDAQEDALIGLYNQSVSNIDTKMVQETRYYDTMMGHDHQRGTSSCRMTGYGPTRFRSSALTRNISTMPRCAAR